VRHGYNLAHSSAVILSSFSRCVTENTCFGFSGGFPQEYQACLPLIRINKQIYWAKDGDEKRPAVVDPKTFRTFQESKCVIHTPA
jgi:hypothetical protein